MTKKLLSQRHPLLYIICVWIKRVQRYISWFIDGEKYCKIKSSERLPFRVKKHSSVLIRKLGDSDLQLQHNKVKNLAIAIKSIDSIIIKKGETFSFCKLVGLPTKRKGYVEGMEISRGEARTGIGGGICQISNLIYWLTLHSPLTIKERSHHSFDPFPDHNRVLPFGSGSAIFYNYLDLQISNNTPFSFQFNLWLTEKCLEGDLRSDDETPYSYYVYEDKHNFLKIGNQYYRRNEIWRRVQHRKGGKLITRELITKNFAEVKYVPNENNNI